MFDRIIDDETELNDMGHFFYRAVFFGDGILLGNQTRGLDVKYKDIAIHGV